LLGIVIVAHGELAQSFVNVAEQMLGRQDYIECIGYNIGDDLETFRYKISEATKRVDRGSGVIIFTDMFGGIPSNVSVSVGYSLKIEVISGFNLGMLLKMLTIREDTDLKSAVHLARDIGIKYTYLLSELLEKNDVKA
jgi:PTS system mannose-specific IIA component